MQQRNEPPPTGQYANIGQTRQDVPNAKYRSLKILVIIEEKKIECRLDYGQQCQFGGFVGRRIHHDHLYHKPSKSSSSP